MHPTQSENLSHTSWIAESLTGVPSATSLLSDILKLWRLVCRRKSPSHSSAHSTICECCCFKQWWKSHQRAKSSLSPSCTSILNIFQFLQRLSLQQKDCCNRIQDFEKDRSIVHHMHMSEWHIQVLWTWFWTSFCQILTITEPHGVVPAVPPKLQPAGSFLVTLLNSKEDVKASHVDSMGDRKAPMWCWPAEVWGNSCAGWLTHLVFQRGVEWSEMNWWCYKPTSHPFVLEQTQLLCNHFSDMTNYFLDTIPWCKGWTEGSDSSPPCLQSRCSAVCCS